MVITIPQEGVECRHACWLVLCRFESTQESASRTFKAIIRGSTNHRIFNSKNRLISEFRAPTIPSYRRGHSKSTTTTNAHGAPATCTTGPLLSHTTRSFFGTDLACVCVNTSTSSYRFCFAPCRASIGCHHVDGLRYDDTTRRMCGWWGVDDVRGHSGSNARRFVLSTCAVPSSSRC
jgi:hypothetical protein